jgi:hypothetical protein
VLGAGSGRVSTSVLVEERELTSVPAAYGWLTNKELLKERELTSVPVAYGWLRNKELVEEEGTHVSACRLGVAEKQKDACVQVPAGGLTVMYVQSHILRPIHEATCA